MNWLRSPSVINKLTRERDEAVADARLARSQIAQLTKQLAALSPKRDGRGRYLKGQDV